MPGWFERLVALLLRCYPTAFRDDYGRQLRSDVARLWRTEAPRGRPALTRLSLSVLFDMLVNAILEHLAILRQDLRAARRSLAKTPAFTLGAVLTLALGIGATTTMYSVVRGVLVRPLPFPEPDRLVELVETTEGATAYDVSDANFLSWQERTRSFTGMAALWSRSFVLTDGIEPERVIGLAASPSLWSVLAVQPIAGHTFADGDLSSDERVVVISDGLFRRRYGGDQSLIGRTVQIGGAAYTLLGVVPADMGFTREVEAWTPWRAGARTARGDRQAEVIARLKPGVTVEQASAEMASVAAALEREFPSTNTGYGARARPLLDYIVPATVDRALMLLLSAAGLLLLVACANVANLVLTRAMSRGPELALRQALGAGRGRLARQILTESLLLAAVGCGAGLLVAAATLGTSRRLLSSALPRAGDVSIDLQTLVVAVATALVTAVAFALIPAWRATRSDVAPGLHATGRTSADRSQVRLRRAFVLAQFCLATILVSGAALVAQSLLQLMTINPGFRTDRLLLANISLPGSYSGVQPRNAFYHRLVDALLAEPGIEAAGLALRTPLTPGAGPGMEVSDTPPVAGVLSGRRAHWRVVTSSYFEAIGIPLLHGRVFDSTELETADGVRTVIVSQSLAERLWPGGEDPIGRQVWLGNGQTRTVVAVVGDVHQGSLADGATSTMYMPTSWITAGTMTLVVRTSGDPEVLTPVIRTAVRRLDSQIPLFGVRTMEAQMEGTTLQSRLNLGLLGGFAAVALMLGLVGVTGVIAHTVALRRPELAIRMALGANAARVVREVTFDGLRICLLGLAAGLLGAWMLRRTLSALLFDMRGNDAITLGLVALGLFGAALAACWLPALRVTRVDPARVLRGE